jgi:NAD(P)-dependent dehydrogenase (short-subunit alcohol dehydrogenase family)
VVGLAANLRREVGPHGVGVTVLCPGVIRTPLFTRRPTGARSQANEVHPDAETHEFYEDRVENAPGPDVVAEAALRAVLDDQLFVLTGSDIGGLVVQRLRALTAALPQRAANQ